MKQFSLFEVSSNSEEPLPLGIGEGTRENHLECFQLCVFATFEKILFLLFESHLAVLRANSCICAQELLLEEFRVPGIGPRFSLYKESTLLSVICLCYLKDMLLVGVDYWVERQAENQYLERH